MSDQPQSDPPAPQPDVAVPVEAAAPADPDLAVVSDPAAAPVESTPAEAGNESPTPEEQSLPHVVMPPPHVPVADDAGAGYVTDLDAPDADNDDEDDGPDAA